MSSFELPALLKLLFLLVISSAPAEKPEAPSKAFLAEVGGAVQVTVDFESLHTIAATNEVAGEFLSILRKNAATGELPQIPGITAEFMQNFVKNTRRLKLIYQTKDYESRIPLFIPAAGNLISLGIPNCFIGGSYHCPWLVCIEPTALESEQVRALARYCHNDLAFGEIVFDGKKIHTLSFDWFKCCYLKLDKTLVISNNVLMMQRFLFNADMVEKKHEAGAQSTDEKQSAAKTGLLASVKMPPELLPLHMICQFDKDGQHVVSNVFSDILENYAGGTAESVIVDVSETAIELKLCGVPSRFKDIMADERKRDFRGFRYDSTVMHKSASAEDKDAGVVDFIFKLDYNFEDTIKSRIEIYKTNRLARLRTESRERLELLGLAFHRYLIKNNKVCPDTLDEVVRYVDLIGEKALFCPMNDKKFVFNERTAGHVYQELLDGDNFDRILVHTPVGADPMGGHILYISGTVRFVSTTQLDVISRGLKGELKPGEDPDVF